MFKINPNLDSSSSGFPSFAEALPPKWVLLPAQTDEQKLAHFTAELDEALKSLDLATEQSAKSRDDMQALQSTLEDRGWWDSVKSSFNGQTDKELATNIRVLGQSLETTQKVIRVILQVQTQKGRLLHVFSDALVKKMTSIQTDTQTLDGNQRAAALAFLGELHLNVREQIRQQDLLDEHEGKLQGLDGWQREKDREQVERERSLQQHQMDSLRWQDRKDQHDAEMVQRVDGVKSETELLTQKLEKSANLLAAIAATHDRIEGQVQTLQQLFETQNTRIEALQRSQTQSNSAAGFLLRHGLILVALGVAVAALLKSL